MNKVAKKGCVLVFSVLVFALLAVAPRRSAGDPGTPAAPPAGSPLPSIGGASTAIGPSTTIGDLSDSLGKRLPPNATGPVAGSSGTLPSALINYNAPVSNSGNVSDSGNTDVNAHAGCCG